MTKNYSGKIAFAGAMVAIALLSRVVYPHLYFGAVGNSDAATTSSLGAIPQFILPALSLANTSGPAISSSSSPVSSGNGNVAMGAVAGGSPTGLSASNSSGAVFVVPAGPVSNSAFSRVGEISPPSLNVEAALVADLTTGTHFMDENATERWPLASVTKLMTATIVLDALDLSQKITITSDAFNADASERTLRVGDVYTVRDLLSFLLLPSSNVAAEALAGAYDGTYGKGQFIVEMNKRAAAWGMADTSYDDPSGIAIGSQSTASDLVLLAQKIYADSHYKDILGVTRERSLMVTEIGSGKEITLNNINEFAGQPDFLGGKTGYTDQADGNLLSLFSYQGHPIVVVVLGTDESARFTNTQALYGWFMKNFKS